MKTVVGEAPGRLDFLGGVADYSGSLVLEMPLRLTTRVTVSEHPAGEFAFVSAQEGRCVVAAGAEEAGREVAGPPASVPARENRRMADSGARFMAVLRWLVQWLALRREQAIPGPRARADREIQTGCRTASRRWAW